MSRYYSGHTHGRGLNSPQPETHFCTILHQISAPSVGCISVAGGDTPAGPCFHHMMVPRRAPDAGLPTPRQEAFPPGTLMPPPQHTRALAVGSVTGPHARTPRTHSQWVVGHTPTPAPTARGQRAPADRPESGQPGEGECLTSDAPHNGGRHPPLGTPYRHPHSAQRQPARARAVGPVLGPHARTDRTRDTRVAEPWLPAPEDGRPGEGQRLTPDAPHNGGRPAPPGTAPHHPRGTQPP